MGVGGGAGGVGGGMGMGGWQISGLDWDPGGHYVTYLLKQPFSQLAIKWNILSDHVSSTLTPLIQ